jgi:diguanylate cyclase (GGDEF)-like protein/PAS domain S-box-containing protein
MLKVPMKVMLLIEDNPGDARLIREMLREFGAAATDLVHVQTLSEAEAYLEELPVDVIVLDLGLSDADGLDAVSRARAAAPRVPLVVVTGRDDEALATQAFRVGAQDYLIKGQIEARGLLRTIRYAIERKGLEEALLAERERAQITLDSIGDGVACTDQAGRITFLNIQAEKLTGWSRQEAMDQPVETVIRILDGNSRRPVALPTLAAMVRDRTVLLPANCLLQRRDGTEVPVEDSVAPIHDRLGRQTGTVIVFRDVSGARTMASQMAHAAQHDFLTGLPNRMLLHDRVSHAIALAARHKQQVALLFLDLDGFKHINDSLGHSVGDGLLRSVANRLLDCVRASDTISRQGGDEFVVLLSSVEQAEDAAITARRMLHAVAQPHTVDQHELHITTSIGVATFPDDGPDTETLIKNADTAMYQTKESGSNSYRFFKPAMNLRAVERQSIEEGLRRALERNEFLVHYQPKYCLRSGTITGAEALIRWTHPIRGPVSPAQFVPIAEDCGLIVPIGAWVMREACRQARQWVDEGLRPTTMAVNVSAREFREEDFVDGLLAILSESGLDPRCLELELTESVLMKRADLAASILTSVRIAGVKVAIDDFGTGYSSLSYLQKFPVDALKIDQSFIRQISAVGDNTAIVTAVIAMARSLELKVVAEGVEKLEQLDFLRAHQCDEAQGYYFSRPIPAAQFAHLLAMSDAGSPRVRPTRGSRMSAISPLQQKVATPLPARLSTTGELR